MPLVSSGEISIGGSTPGRSINSEFGRAANATTSMSQLYRGGDIVPNATVNNAIPTSGTISLSQFYGATNRVPINIVLSTNQTNYVLNTAKAAGYVAGVSDITLTINSGVYVSSNNTSVPALNVDTSWAAGDTITIVNNGFIVGMGGAGGAGQSVDVNANLFGGSAGAAGGLAFRAQRAVSVNNAGTIAGGGGGGGGGAAYKLLSVVERPYYHSVAGGGGGGGRSSAAANSNGGSAGISSTEYNANGSPGGAGTVSSPGNGGAGGIGGADGVIICAGAGGTGGNWGAPGAPGGNARYNTYPLPTVFSGGSAGAAVSGNANITWITTGTRLGVIT
jgi:hypothetical protein